MSPLLLLVVVLSLGAALAMRYSSPCRQYGGCRDAAQRHYPYLPAPPGKTPRCAKPGATFCEVADHYPAHLVQYLIDRWAFDFNTLLGSETQDEFNFRYPVSYGPYGPSLANTLLPGRETNASQAYEPALVYGEPGPGYQDGYPDRRYRLDVSQTSITYPPPSVQPAPAATGRQSPNQQWWARYKRDAAARGIPAARTRRQAPDGASTTTLCPTSSRFITPQAALNTQGNWMFVANVPEATQPRYTQLVRAETCISSQCDGLCSLPNGYTSRCEQQYVQRRLVALGGGGDRLYTDTFWFPHCCVCQISAPAAGG